MCVAYFVIRSLYCIPLTFMFLKSIVCDGCFVKGDEEHKIIFLCHMLGDGWAMSLDSVIRTQS